MSTSFLPITNKIFIQQPPDEIMPKIMLVDMNSFFASVEQQANPKLRGKPLGVCASIHETSCLIATSKEAKAMGLKNGVPIYKAKKVCPGIIIVESEPEKYREVSRKVNQIFRSYSNMVQAYSIDESFLDLSESKLNPMVVGSKIKQRIKDEVGEWLTCSVGIAQNKFMAKLGADLQKPDGLSVIWRENLPSIYRNLKFTDLWGVARGWSKRLNNLGIVGPYQFLSYPVSNLLAVFGKPGFYIWQRIHGLEQDQVQSLEDDPKSFGHSWVLNFRTRNKGKLEPVVMRLAEKCARRMRRDEFKSRGIYLSVTDVAGNYFHVSKKLSKPINTGQELYREAINLWANWQFKYEIMHIAVGFTNLLADCCQLDLFGDKNPGLVKVLDKINDRYGEFTIRSGLLAQTSSFAPDAIAFGK
jgi:DNA polymerase-4